MRRMSAAAAILWLAAACSDTGAQTAAGEVDPDAATLGGDDAPILIVEYASTTCPVCAQFHATLFPYVKETWIDAGQAQLVMRVLPTPPAELSVAGSLLARCAGPDRYFDVLEELFASQQELMASAQASGALAFYQGIGAEHGLNADEVQACMSDEAGIASIDASIDAAHAAGINGTPTFVINGEVRSYVGDLDTTAEWDAAMEAALARARPPR